MNEENFTDFSSVRDRLLEAQERRGFLSYEQKMALQHAEWAASDGRGGYKTDPTIFASLVSDFIEIDKLAKSPGVAAKLAELLPLTVEDVRAILASKRIAADADEIELILNLVRKQIM